METEPDEVITLRMGGRKWQIGKKLLCSKSAYFRGVLSGPARPDVTRVFELSSSASFTQDQVGWMITLFQTGTCPEWERDQNSLEKSFEFYKTGVYFSSEAVTSAVLGAVVKQLVAISTEIQLDESRLVSCFPLLRGYLDLVFGEGAMADSAIKSAFLDFVHRIRFPLLKHDGFNALLDELPALSHAMFARMRKQKDFKFQGPDPVKRCTKCRKTSWPRYPLYFARTEVHGGSLRFTCSDCCTPDPAPAATEKGPGMPQPQP